MCVRLCESEACFSHTHLCEPFFLAAAQAMQLCNTMLRVVCTLCTSFFREKQSWFLPQFCFVGVEKRNAKWAGRQMSKDVVESRRFGCMYVGFMNSIRICEIDMSRRKLLFDFGLPHVHVVPFMMWFNQGPIYAVQLFYVYSI